MPRNKSRSSASLEDILASHNPKVRLLVEQLRKIIRATIPLAGEAANDGWHSINFCHPTGGYFCGVFPRNDYVDLVFEFGVLLPDTDGLLEGDGKQVRYVRFKDEKDVRVRALKELLWAAISLPVKREVKLALIKAGAKPVYKNAKFERRFNHTTKARRTERMNKTKP